MCASSVEHNADVLKGIEERQEDFPEQQCIFLKPSAATQWISIEFPLSQKDKND